MVYRWLHSQPPDWIAPYIPCYGQWQLAFIRLTDEPARARTPWGVRLARLRRWEGLPAAFGRRGTAGCRARPLSRAWSSLIQGSGHRLRRWPSHRGGGKAGSGGATAIKARPRSPDRLRLLIGSTPINRTGVPDSPVPVPADTSRTCPFRGSTAELVLRTAATDPVRLLAPKAEGLLVSLTATELAYQPVSSLRRPGLPGGLGSRVRLDYWADDRRAAHSWSRMDISTSSYQRPSWSTDSRWRPSSTNPAFW